MTEERSPFFMWSVELPARGAALGYVRPKAHLLIESSEGGSETWSVPVAVGKVLNKGLADGSLHIRSRAELAFEVKKVQADCGHLRIESLVNKRDFSFKELSEKLLLDGYSREVVQSLCERARDAGVVDDQRFAQSFIRTKMLSGWGRIKIERELRRRGIDVLGVDGWPDEFFEPGDELERACALALKKRLTGKNDFQKIARFLCNKGFSPSVAFDAAKAALRENEEDW